MSSKKNYFDFPECGDSIDIHEDYNSYKWNKASLIKLGSNRNPKVVVKGQYHENELYLDFEIQDNSLRIAEDSLTICIDSSRAIQPSPENVLLGYELTFGDEGRRLTCIECDNSNYVWKEQRPAPSYIDWEITKDALHCYWNTIVKINFEGLIPLDINPDSFGLYIKVLDYNGAIKPANYYYPEAAHGDVNNPDYIPPHEQWAIGRFLKKHAEDK